MTDCKSAVTPLIIPGRKPNEKFVLWITNILSIDECKEWISCAEKQIFKPASLLTSGEISKNPYRNNDRVFITDINKSSLLTERLKYYLPKELSGENLSKWILVGLNTRLCFLRYNKDEHYGKHVDISYEDEKTGQRSFITVQLYLNEDFVGGETRFDQEVGFTRMEDKKYLDVVPKTGSVLLFEHELTHEGCAVKTGTKYAVRIDVMYQKQ